MKKIMLYQQLYMLFQLLSFNIGEGEENETDSGEINIDDLQNEKNYVSIINTKIDCKKNNCNYSGSTFFKESVVLNRGNSHLTIKNGNVFFAKDVYVDGGTSITVNGNAFFSNGFHLKGSGILNVSGNVYMKSPYYSSTGNGHTLCVSGKIYEIDTNDITIEKSISKNSCGKSTTNPEPDSELPFVIQWNPTPIMLEDIVYGKKK